MLSKLCVVALMAVAVVGNPTQTYSDLAATSLLEVQAAEPLEKPVIAQHSTIAALASESVEQAMQDAFSAESHPSLVETSTEAAQGPTGRLPTARALEAAKDKLDVALGAIKQDILVRNRQIEDEKKWVTQVKAITDAYMTKIQKVTDDIEKTKGEVKTLFHKKKQIENLKIQRALEGKLKDATADLGTLQSALAHVKTKAADFQKTKNEIKRTILGIHTQLAKLKGEKVSPKTITDLAKAY